MRCSRRMLSLAGVALALAAAPAPAATPNPHAVIECTFCHADTPRFGIDTRDTVNFWRAEGDEPALCERCHGPEANFHPLGVEPGPERLGTRTPARLPLGQTEAVRGQVVCTTCHFLHAANGDFALLRGFPGSDRPGAFRAWQELCRECHGAGLERRSPHAGDERACAFCHAAKPQEGQPVSVTQQGRRLCEFCHGTLGEEHYAGVNSFGRPQVCTGCHDPHLGKDHPARLRRGYFDPIRDAVTLNPHGKRTLCFACHAGEAGPELRTSDAIALCQRCHGSGRISGMSHPPGKVPGGYAIPQDWPLAGGRLTCLTCHLPGHVADRGVRKLLRWKGDGGNAVCFACHPRGQWEGIDPHREAAQENTGCARCHAARPVWGTDTAETVTFVADVQVLCLACHDVAPHPGGAVHTVKLSDLSRKNVPDALPLGSGNRLTCATCHNPHVDRPPGQPRLRLASEGVAFCSRCHSF
ncbi:MAG TPA: cytochrome c3 family protein [Candidatus Methanoperedens sp.]|nr:cytochrome c3 family protein [Candidatus Methanoperedens sp.]